MSSVIALRSTITCPGCGHQHTEIMAEDSCQYFYECTACQLYLKPLAGDCCVFCSFGDIKCPPIQQGSKCCS